MNLGSLRPSEGHKKNRKRIGRGEGSGSGVTAGKGNKGGQARTGFSYKVGFEGGQMPLQRRIPKFGFKNPFKEIFSTVNLERLQELAEGHAEVKNAELDQAMLHKLGAIKTLKHHVKVLGRGELKASLTVKAHKFSEAAKTAIEQAGGKAIVIEQPTHKR